jgi:adenylate kinase family enzyme
MPFSYRRIVLLGCAGAGKSTLGAALAEAIGAPFLCLDSIWLPDWTNADVPAFRALMADVHAGEAWVSDGNFAQATFDIRLPRADLIVWLDRPRWLCALRAMGRVLRPDEAHRPGDLVKVLRFIWGFERLNRPRIEGLRLAIAPGLPVISLRTDTDIAAFLDQAAG